MPDETCEDKLARMKTALEQLVIGGIVSVSHNGRSVTYGRGDITALKKIIAALELECGTGAGTTTTSRGRARSVTWWR